MAQAVAVGAVDVRPIVERMHLMDADSLQLVLVRLEHVEQRDRLAVREREDQVGAGAYVPEDSLRR